MLQNLLLKHKRSKLSDEMVRTYPYQHEIPKSSTYPASANYLDGQEGSEDIRADTTAETIRETEVHWVQMRSTH